MLESSALSSAFKIGKKSRAVRFDWSDTGQVMEKVEEEWRELKEAIRQGHPQTTVGEELGDLLFTVAQLARHLKLHPEQTLISANKKFLNRFHHMKRLIESDGLALLELSTAEMEAYWKKVKELEKQNK